MGFVGFGLDFMGDWMLDLVLKDSSGWGFSGHPENAAKGKVPASL